MYLCSAGQTWAGAGQGGGERKEYRPQDLWNAERSGSGVELIKLRGRRRAQVGRVSQEPRFFLGPQDRGRRVWASCGNQLVVYILDVNMETQ